MKDLTSRQQEILEFISSSIRDRGYPPTIREIGKHMGIRSTNGVNDHLKALERKGHLTRDDLKSRAMRPVQLADDMLEIPVMGRVAAGMPALAVEHREDTVRVDRFFIGNERGVFALRILGESMIEDGIFDGDYVFVKKSSIARPGDIVIALIDDDATCKRYFPEGDHVRFQPAHPTMQPIIVHQNDFRQTMILGTVIGVYRRM